MSSENSQSKFSSLLSSVKDYLTIRFNSRRELTDFLFKALLGIVMLIIVAPFFLVLAQVASVGFWEVFGSEPGQGLEFLWSFPGVGLEGGIRNAIVGTVELVVIAGAQRQENHNERK